MKVLSAMNGDYYRKAQVFKVQRTKYPVVPSPLRTNYRQTPETWAQILDLRIGNIEQQRIM